MHNLLILTSLALADPFAPPAQAVPAPSVAPAAQTQLQLNAIFILGAEREAQINNRYVRVNDWLGPWQVISISSEAVVLQRGSQPLRLTLPNADPGQIILEVRP